MSDEVQDLNVQLCEKCGWTVGVPYQAEITTNDKLEFVSAMLSGRRWSKTFPLFGGKMSVRFESRKAKDSDILTNAMNEKFGPTPFNEDKIRAFYEYGFGMCLREIRRSNGNTTEFPNLDLVNLDGIRSRLDAISSQEDEAVIMAAKAAFSMFENMYQLLTARATDPNFYEDVLKSEDSSTST